MRRQTALALLLLWSTVAAVGDESHLSQPSPAPLPEKEMDAARANEAWQRALELDEEGTVASWRKAVEEYSKALEYYRISGNASSEARARSRLARVHFFLDDRAKALEYYEQALSQYRVLEDRSGEAGAHNGLGAVYQEMAEPTRAIEHFTAAITVFRATGERVKEATVLHNLGWYHYSLGQFRKSNEFYARALPLWRAAGNVTGEAQTINNLGLLNWCLGELERARQYFETALQLRRTLKSRQAEAQVLANLGSVHRSLGERDKAADLFRQSLALAEEMGEKANQASALLWLATLDPQHGSAEAAQKIHTALNLSQQINDKRLEAIALRRLSEWHSARGDIPEAERNYSAALALQKQTGSILGEADTLLAIAHSSRHTGNLDEARIRAEQAIDAIESARGQVAQPHLRASFGVSLQDYYDLYIDILMRLHEREPRAAHDVKALQVSEQARSRGLLEALAEQQADIRSDVDPRLLAREQELHRALSAKDQRLRNMLAGPHDDASIAVAKRELDEALHAVRELQGEIRARNPRYASLTQSEPISLQALQQHLDDDDLLLEYWLGSERSFLWAVTATSISSHVLPAADVIEHQARQYFALLTTRPARPAAGRTAKQPKTSQLATALGNTLLGPVVDELRNRRLIIVSHGALQYLPFAALTIVSSADGSTPLVHDHELANLPSASVLPILRAHSFRKPPEKLIAVLADPVFSTDDERLRRQHPGRIDSTEHDEELHRSAADAGLDRLLRLRYSRVEANAIASLVADSQRFEAVDFQASRATALSDELGRYRILHFATHGLINSVHPELSGLVFSAVDENGRSQDALLRLHEIFNLSLNAQLVVLSACRTALGQDIKGEGLIGLTRGFMHAGSPRVIASLWNVDDRATAELMKKFYAGLLNRGLTPAAALRDAQLALRNDKRWSAAYYWAGFVLQGDWH